MFYCAISPTEISWLLFQLVCYEAQGVGAVEFVPWQIGAVM